MRNRAEGCIEKVSGFVDATVAQSSARILDPWSNHGIWRNLIQKQKLTFNYAFWAFLGAFWIDSESFQASPTIWVLFFYINSSTFR